MNTRLTEELDNKIAVALKVWIIAQYDAGMDMNCILTWIMGCMFACF